MKTILLFLFVSFSINGKAQNTAEHYKTSKFDAAIFPAKSLDMIPGTRFTPTRLEVDIAESALARQIKTLNTPMVNQYKSPVIHKNLRKYRRQYFGYFDEDGHKILYINCFYNRKNNEYGHWLNSKVSVLDGGCYYWSIRFDLHAKKFSELYINGSG